MARKPRDYDAEIAALKEKARRAKEKRTLALGQLVEATGAASIPGDALAGVLLAAVAASKDEITEYAAVGRAAFRGTGAKPGKRPGAQPVANGPVGKASVSTG